MTRVPIIIFGAGGVGRSLLRQIVESRKIVSERAGCRLKIIGLVDSKSWAWAEDGFAEVEIRNAIDRKVNQGTIGGGRPDGSEILSQFAGECGDIGLMVDVTAAEGMETLANQALALELGVVLANKKPLTGPWELSGQFFRNPRMRYEATVGGGLPVIGTLRTILDSGDDVLSISGQMSGTMNSITRQMDNGVPFSEALKMARASGVSEPDPREDLNGWDVMRKLVILGRVAGWQMELDEIEVESLTPPSLANLPLEEFIDSISELDDSMREWRETAKKVGRVLRYLAQVEKGQGSVGLKAIRASNPTAASKMMALRTRRYDQEPLYIGSNTSGIETTAAAVLSDMLSLVREWQLPSRM